MRMIDQKGTLLGHFRDLVYQIDCTNRGEHPAQEERNKSKKLIQSPDPSYAPESAAYGLCGHVRNCLPQGVAGRLPGVLPLAKSVVARDVLSGDRPDEADHREAPVVQLHVPPFLAVLTLDLTRKHIHKPERVTITGHPQRIAEVARLPAFILEERELEPACTEHQDTEASSARARGASLDARRHVLEALKAQTRRLRQKADAS